tara:strand:+ start:281 stop:580 length:300 start_codon:yes stop_codon:yes gene_type:complete
MSDTPIRDIIMKDQEKYTTCQNVNCKAHGRRTFGAEMDFYNESYSQARFRNRGKQKFDYVESYVLMCHLCRNGVYYGEWIRNGSKLYHHTAFNITKGNV